MAKIDMEGFVLAVENMREAQRAYFRTRDRAHPDARRFTGIFYKPGKAVRA